MCSSDLAWRYDIGVPGKAEMRRPVADAGEQIVDPRRPVVVEGQALDGEASRFQRLGESVERTGVGGRHAFAADQALRDRKCLIADGAHCAGKMMSAIRRSKPGRAVMASRVDDDDLTSPADAEDHRLEMGSLSHGSQGVAAEAIRPWRALEDAEIDQEPEADPHSDQRADPAERVGLIRRSGKSERL